MANASNCSITTPATSITIASVAADCSDQNLQITVASGQWYEYCCTGLDGSTDVSYDAAFHSFKKVASELGLGVKGGGGGGGGGGAAAGGFAAAGGGAGAAGGALGLAAPPAPWKLK